MSAVVRYRAGFANVCGVKGQSKSAGEEVPWDEATLAKHKAAKDAPSALNAVVVPNMTLPQVSTPPTPRDEYILAVLMLIGCLGCPRQAQQVGQGRLPLSSRVA